MGVGLAVDCRWAFPIQSSTVHQRHPPPRSSSRVQETFNEQVKVHTLSPFLDGSISNECHTTSFTCLNGNLTLDKYSSVEKIALSDKIFSSSILLRSSGNSDNEGSSANASCSEEDDLLQFRLLMENISKIEDFLSNSYLSKLERDILVYIGRLGALELFHSYLFKSFREPCVPDSMVPQNPLNDCPVGLSPECECQKRDVIIHSTKKAYRELKRKRRYEKAAKIPIVFSASNAATNFAKATCSRTSPGSSVNSKRSHIARGESELAATVREVSSLERIRQNLEESGRSPTLANWAKAAGIGPKVLLQRLHYGWLCRDKLLESIHSLILYISRGYNGKGINLDDLVQAGNIGVLLGAERFEIERGYKFSTYVRHWIKKYVSLVVQQSRGIRISARMENIIRQIQKVKKSATFNDGSHLQDSDITELTGLSLADIRLAKKYYRAVNSIDQNLRGCFNIKLTEILSDTSIEAPEASTMRQHLRNDVHKLLESLDPHEKQVLLLRYGLQDGRYRSLSEVGAIFHVSRQRINKIEKTALAKLRKEEIKDAMKYYMYI